LDFLEFVVRIRDGAAHGGTFLPGMRLRKPGGDQFVRLRCQAQPEGGHPPVRGATQ
jgi:hypothetical protein